MFYEAQLGTLHRYCTINTTYPQIQPQQQLPPYQQQMPQPPSHHHQIQPSDTGSHYQQPRQTFQLTQSDQDAFSGPQTASQYVSNFTPIG